MSTAAQPALVSPARVAANRENAQHSTGPLTPEGKAAVSQNALKHGLYSQTALLPTEDRADFEAAFASLVHQHAPCGDAETAVVRSLNACEWRLARTRRTEVYLLALGIREQASHFENEPDPETRDGLTQAAAFRANARLLDQLRRHENHFLREHAALLLALESLQYTRQFLVPQSNVTGAPSSQTCVAGTKPPGGEMPHFVGPLREFKRKQWLRNNAR